MEYSRYLNLAKASAIIRAHQKDESFVKDVESKILDTIREFKGAAFVQRGKNWIRILSRVVYLLTTMGIGSRTLGEEYVDIRYVNNNRNIGIRRRLLYVIACIIPLFATRLGNIAQYGKLLSQLNLILFYFFGRYYDIGKRLLGMEYVSSSGEVSKDNSNVGKYKYLGMALAAQLTFQGIVKVKDILKERQMLVVDIDDNVNEKEHDSEKEETEEAVEFKTETPCLLCLSPLENAAAAGCGHVFCWTCVLEWAQQSRSCPLCRAALKPQQLLLLR